MTDSIVTDEPISLHFSPGVIGDDGAEVHMTVCDEAGDIIVAAVLPPRWARDAAALLLRCANNRFPVRKVAKVEGVIN